MFLHLLGLIKSLPAMFYSFQYRTIVYLSLVLSLGCVCVCTCMHAHTWVCYYKWYCYILFFPGPPFSSWMFINPWNRYVCSATHFPILLGFLLLCFYHYISNIWVSYWCKRLKHNPFQKWSLLPVWSVSFRPMPSALVATDTCGYWAFKMCVLSTEMCHKCKICTGLWRLRMKKECWVFHY